MFKGRSEKEIWLATAELQKRNSSHDKQLTVRAKKLAEFLSTAEAEEVLLAQRLQDAQGKMASRQRAKYSPQVELLRSLLCQIHCP